MNQYTTAQLVQLADLMPARRRNRLNINQEMTETRDFTVSLRAHADGASIRVVSGIDPRANAECVIALPADSTEAAHVLEDTIVDLYADAGIKALNPHKL